MSSNCWNNGSRFSPYEVWKKKKSKITLIAFKQSLISISLTSTCYFSGIINHLDELSIPIVAKYIFNSQILDKSYIDAVRYFVSSPLYRKYLASSTADAWAIICTIDAARIRCRFRSRSKLVTIDNQYPELHPDPSFEQLAFYIIDTMQNEKFSFC